MLVVLTILRNRNNQDIVTDLMGVLVLRRYRKTNIFYAIKNNHIQDIDDLGITVEGEEDILENSEVQELPSYKYMKAIENVINTKSNKKKQLIGKYNTVISEEYQDNLRETFRAKKQNAEEINKEIVFNRKLWEAGCLC